MLDVKDVKKAYRGNTILNGVSFGVNTGDVLAVAGRNGTGKSTLLSIIAGQLKPDGGGALLHGENVLRRGAAAKIGYVPQDDLLFDDLSVKDNLRFWAAASGVRFKSAEELPFAALLDIAPFAKKKVKHLSGGMRRRVTLCASLVKDPSLVVLDEPFSGLDMFFKNELMSCLKELAGAGKTIIYASHSGDEIEGLSNKLAVISGGVLAYFGPTEDAAAGGGSTGDFILKLIREREK